MGRMYTADPVTEADALVVLGGGSFGEREEKGCEIYRAGYVRGTVILTGDNHQKNIPDRQVFIQACGVPGQVIIRWPDVKNTFEEMSRIAYQVRTGQMHRVIVVSDPTHMPRLRYLRKILNLEATVIFNQSRSASSPPLQLYRLLLFWYREPLAYLYYRMKY